MQEKLKMLSMILLSALWIFLMVLFFILPIEQAKADNSVFFGIRTHDFKDMGYSGQICNKACIDIGYHKNVLLTGLLFDATTDNNKSSWGRLQAGVGLLKQNNVYTIVGLGGVGVGALSEDGGVEVSYKVAIDRDKIVMRGWDLGIRLRESEEDELITPMKKLPTPPKHYNCKHPHKHKCGDDKHRNKHD